MLSDSPPSAGLALSFDPAKPPILTAPPLSDISSAKSWITEHRDALRADLAKHGHLLVRGLPVRDADDFAVLRDVLLSEQAVYQEKATPRTAFGKGIFSSTDLPPAQPIQLHNENSYTLNFPGILIFCCVQAPEVGGATVVADVRAVLAGLPTELVERFQAVGWLLTRNYHEHVGLPWAAAFGSARREVVEDYCSRSLVGLEWIGAESLRTVHRRSAVISHPVTGEQVWFNHAAFWSRWSLDYEVRDVLTDTYGDDGLPFDTAFGDGSPLGEEDARILNEAYRTALRRESWQVGDLMLVDNILSAHGREAYSGQRKILVAMGEPVELAKCSPTVAPAPQPVFCARDLAGPTL